MALPAVQFSKELGSRNTNQMTGRVNLICCALPSPCGDYTVYTGDKMI